MAKNVVFYTVFIEFSFLGAMTSFHFIITLVLTVKILTSLHGITEKIQGRSFDILYETVNEVNLKVVTKWNISGTKACLKKVQK